MVGAKDRYADLRASLARATTLRRGLQYNRVSYVRLPYPSVPTSC
jgi:hypothetical protein